MPKIRMTLEEQLTDSRSNEVAYRLKVENIGSEAVDLINLTPQVQEGGELVDEKDSSVVAAKKEHEKLCEELTQILRDYQYTEVEEFQNRLLELNRKHFKTFVRDLNSIWRLYFTMLSGEFLKRMERRKKEEDSLIFKINNTADAEIATAKWIDTDKPDNILKSVFAAKVEQLKAIENSIGSDASAVAMTNIEAGSFYASTYVIKFERSYLSARKFNFTVEGQYSETGKDEYYLDSTSSTIAITPRPFVLSLIAMASALLGVSLKFSISPANSAEVFGYFRGLGAQLITGPGISSGILALLLFNIFEHTSLGEKVKMGVNWRSALLIGILCGMFSDRMIEALKVLVGA